MRAQLLFWLIDLLFPAGLLVVGSLWRGMVPRRPCIGRGYCTPRSMRNSRSWRYAQRCFGEFCLRFGGALMILVSADRTINLLTGLMPAARLSYLNAAAALGLSLSIVPLVELALARRSDLAQPLPEHRRGCAYC